jgi:putative FmdB family regulatory protein
MPLYDYRCQDCGHVFEARQGMSEPVLTMCPVCPGRVTRLISKNVMVSFKGAGFYVTDSKPSSETGAAVVPGTPSGEPLSTPSVPSVASPVAPPSSK